MISFENVEIVGWGPAIREMRNPPNSWAHSDSGICKGGDNGIHCENCALQKTCTHAYDNSFKLGKNDHHLMMQLRTAGPDQKFMRMLIVYVDITAPLYWWKEFDTYVTNDCSAMPKIAEKEFEWADFSIEQLTNYGMWGPEFTEADATYAPAKVMGCVISALNGARDKYLDFASRGPLWAERAKQAWWQMIQLLPSSYNQRRTVMMNYEVLANIYESCKDHKLDEWSLHPTLVQRIRPLSVSAMVGGSFSREYTVKTIGKEYFGFCDWAKTLPYSDLITKPM